MEHKQSVGMPQGAKRQFVTATVIRADGRVEHLGVIADRHRNPIIHAYLQMKQWWRDRKRAKS